MLANIQNVLSLYGAHYKDIIVYGLIMVSAIIVAIGLLKPILFNRIPNKHVRKVALALTNVATCYLTVLVYFLVCGISLEFYVIAATALSVTCIVTYWLYENTCLRNLIGLIGSMALRKVFFAITSEDVEAVKTELKKTGEELKAHTKQELKKTAAKVKEDKDLKTL